MEWLLRNNRGYTFIEVLTIAGVGALLIVALTALVGRSIHITRDQSQQVRTTDEARKQLERTSNIIRSGQDVVVGGVVKNWLESGDSFSLTVYSNVDGDPAIERVRYVVDQSDPTTINQGVLQPDSDGNYVGSEEITALTHSLRNQQPDQALFYYKDKEGNVLSTPLSSDDLKKVVTVGMAWRIDADPNTDPAAQDIGTEVTPRRNTVLLATPVPVLLPPTDFECEALSSTKIQCKWVDPNPVSPDAPAEDGFKYYDVDNGVVIDETIEANITSYIESGLTPATEYTRDVTAFNAEGETAHSNPDTVTTLPRIFGTPTLDCAATSGSTATCNVSDAPPVPPGEPTPTPVVDILDTITDPPFPRKTDAPIDINGHSTIMLGGLEPGRSYDVGAQVRKEEETSELSNIETIETPCTIGGLLQITPSPTPSTTPNPVVSPVPTPRYTSSTTPCLTIGLSVLNVFRVDPTTEAIEDRSAEYTWWAYPERQPNQRVNGGTPGPFYELQIVQGNPYVIGITHNTPNALNGRDECGYLTNAYFPAPLPGNVPEPIIVAPGSGESNYKLNFYYMPLAIDSSYTTPGDNKFPCQIYEARGGLVRPKQPLVRLQHVFANKNGVVTDYFTNTANGWFDRTPNTPPSSQLNQNFTWRYYYNRQGIYTDATVPHSIYFGNKEKTYTLGSQFVACNKLTDGANAITLPLTNPWPHFYTDLEFWSDKPSQPPDVYEDFVYNCSLREHWSGTIIKAPLFGPKISVNSVKLNGDEAQSVVYHLTEEGPTLNWWGYYDYRFFGGLRSVQYQLPVTDLSYREKPKNYGIIVSATRPVMFQMWPGWWIPAFSTMSCSASLGTIPQDKTFNISMTYTEFQQFQSVWAWLNTGAPPGGSMSGVYVGPCTVS